MPSQQPKSRRALRLLNWLSWLPVGMLIDHYGLTVRRLPGSLDDDNKSPAMVNPLALIDRFTPAFICRYRVGDVVLYRSPSEPDRLLMGRVIAKQGEVVKPKASWHITGPYRHDSQQPVGITPTHVSSVGSEFVQVPKGSCWVEMDRRLASLSGGQSGRQEIDSNTLGPIQMGLIVGRPLISIKPFSRLTGQLNRDQMLRVAFI